MSEAEKLFTCFPPTTTRSWAFDAGFVSFGITTNPLLSAVNDPIVVFVVLLPTLVLSCKVTF